MGACTKGEKTGVGGYGGEIGNCGMGVMEEGGVPWGSRNAAGAIQLWQGRYSCLCILR